MKSYEVVVDGEVVISTIDKQVAEASAFTWRGGGRRFRVEVREQNVPEELVELVSLCHRMNIERCRGRHEHASDLFAEILMICGKCKP